MSTFFLQRPVLAWVLALLVALGGAVGLTQMPLAQYPDVAPPAVMVTAHYPGASAEVVENSVTKVLEQELKGLPRLLYFSATSNASGSAELMLTFAQGTDIDAALVQAQALANQAARRLPASVQRLGLQVRKLQNSFLMVIAVHDRDDRRSATDIADWMATTLEDAIGRVEGVGAVQAFDAPHAMRIWLDPHRLHAAGLVPGDVVTAIENQNRDLSLGELGAQPAAAGQAFNVPVTARSRLQTPQQFGDLVLKTMASGATVRLSQVARVEIGAESYGSISRLDGHPASALAVRLAPGANALKTAEAIRAQVEALRHEFPAGFEVSYPEDSTRFVRLSIAEVLKTLAEAMVLVVVVMRLFLGSWRATWVPTLTVPLVLLGTAGVLALLGMSINTLTLFAMVLAIGLLVDDTIVVVENVERLMAEAGLSPREATLRSMQELGSALVGIGLVLGCIFLPMGLFAGSVGVIYRQFSVTLVAAMALSVLVALVFTPVLCAGVLRARLHAPPHARAARWQLRGLAGLSAALRRPLRVALVYGAIAALAAWGHARLPRAFLPEEDSGTVMVRYSLPPGSPAARSLQLADELQRYFRSEEADTTATVYANAGMSFDGAGQNAGMAFVSLKPWSARRAADQRAQAIAERAMARLAALPAFRDAEVYAMVPPALDGLGEAGGFELWLQDSAGQGRERLRDAAAALTEQARTQPTLAAVRSPGSEPLPRVQLDIDELKAATLGIAPDLLHDTLETAWGGRYVNDFVHGAQIRKVLVQGDAPFRAATQDLAAWHVRGRDGRMTSLAEVASSRWDAGPGELQRFNGVPAVPVQGLAAPGSSSGAAMATMGSLVAATPGVRGAWAGLSFEEQRASGQAAWLYGVSLLFIFLCLAALYESWLVPCAVMAVVPLGLAGAVAAALARGLPDDIYFQVGLLACLGLSAKNAVLIVEFAEARRRAGAAALDAALAAVGARLRPILMTSLAFGAGIVPLALAGGPGAGSQQALGTAVLGGVVSGTALTLVFVPAAYALLARWLPGERMPRPAPSRQPGRGVPA